MAKALVSGFKHLTVKMGTRYAGSSPVLTTDGITVGKEYRVTERIGILENTICNDTISIINEWGSERYYLSDLFISKSEWRQNKLDILLGTTSS